MAIELMENNAEDESKKEEKQNMEQNGTVEEVKNNAEEDESKREENQNMEQEGTVEGVKNNAAEDESKKDENQNMEQEGTVEGVKNNAAEDESKKDENQNMEQEGTVEGVKNNAAEDESKKDENQNMEQEGIVEGVKNNAEENASKKEENKNMNQEGIVEGVKNDAAEDESEKKKRKHHYYGNYKHYYASRNGGKFNQDPRLEIFKKEWFQGKDCLDIGCNSGIVTICIAEKFCCRSILGIDIDPGRIKEAQSNLRKAVRSIYAEKRMRLQGSQLNKLLKQTQVFENDILKDQGKYLNKPAEPAENLDQEIPRRNLGHIVSFKQENFLEAAYDPHEEHYDTILCLSVTQWIHLNWGDDGLMTLFSKIRDLLRPGGLFVLEPHKWKSYRRKRKITETTYLNYKSIKLRPERFMRTLLEKVGFKALIHFSSSERINGKSHYNRDILVFKKSELSHAEKAGA
ncbi:hypothetical protein TanjilG_06833 [Lupinus angustifolius]|uniref:RNA methyltransferase n=1 Tax=Lupinus angustifolius TaxID=3871 RepID=A0A1J7GNH5_LUPAN|nr:hypothetical protein TanjilG_06833 [Lupinus angustifolius]